MSLTISVTSPQKVLALFNTTVEGTTNDFATLQLLRGSQVLMQAGAGGLGGTWMDEVALFSLDQPGTGNFTYSVQWLTNAGTLSQNLQPYAATGDRQLNLIILPA
jgi:hypothetical protein